MIVAVSSQKKAISYCTGGSPTLATKSRNRGSWCKRLKRAGGSERGESQVVPLVSDFEILQSLVFLPQGCVGNGQFKG